MNNTSEYAPIVLFVYNRLNHTKMTIDALLKNSEAKDSEIYIYSDGPKKETDIADVNAVRKYISKITGFKKITIIEQDKNKGLANNIIEGVTEIVNRFGRIIVLEDDIVTSPFFLSYMNTALELYKYENKVMEISGYGYPINKNNLPECGFLRFADCWGWGTWKRAWDKFERNPEKTIKDFSKDDIFHFNLDGASDFWSQVIDNKNGVLYTWAIFWQVAIYKNDGLMLYPRDSLVYNCGFDGSGDHGEAKDLLNSSISHKKVTEFPIEIEECELLRERLKSFFKSVEPKNIIKIKGKIKKIVLKILKR